MFAGSEWNCCLCNVFLNSDRSDWTKHKPARCNSLDEVATATQMTRISAWIWRNPTKIPSLPCEGLNDMPIIDMRYVCIHIYIYIHIHICDYPFAADTRPSVFHLPEVGWYAIVEIPVDWFVARTLCLQLGGYIASVESKTENDDLEKFLKQLGKLWFIICTCLTIQYKNMAG